MNNSLKSYIVRNISVDLKKGYGYSEGELFEKTLKKIRLKKAHSISLYKRSVDARNKNNVKYVCSVLVKTDRDLSGLPDVDLLKSAEPVIEIGKEKLEERPVVVGFGPCGMFCALMLAQNGYRPIVIERGEDIPERKEKVRKFYETKNLDCESNIQFGAGGAGTFSDGKLVTRINDSKCNFVLNKLVEFGAPEEILISAKPHIGTDNLQTIVSRIKDELINLGSEIRFNTKLTGITESNTIEVNSNEHIKFGALVLAIGHSARDTYGILDECGYELVPKAFSVGVRAEHLQSDIDVAMYGDFVGTPTLGHAEYALSKRIGNRAVYTFCMCPGGEVVAATTEQGSVVVNGMSEFARCGRNANAAVAVSVDPSDYGNTVKGAIEFQRKIEKAAFSAGGGAFAAPVQTLGDFMNSRVQSVPKRITPTYMADEKQGAHCNITDINKIFPPFVNEMLKIGFSDFDKKIKGYGVSDAVLTAPETRTSSPVRILRTDDFFTSRNSLIYPAGEGAGYAGGITSAAVDGINTAMKIMKRFAP